MTSILPQVSINDENIQSSIDNIQLSNYPNPFNPSTTISFSSTTELTENTEMKINIYNIKGQKVKSIFCNKLDKCSYSVIWDGKDDSGVSVSSGVYFYKLSIDDKTELVKKCILLK
jgi:flagellar hook assembly protein FlgD